MPKEKETRTNLKLDGKPFELFPPSSVFQNIINYLDHLPDDELYTKTEVEVGASVGSTRLQSFSKSRFSAGYVLIHGIRPKTYLGNKRAILALQAEIKRQETEEVTRSGGVK